MVPETNLQADRAEVAKHLEHLTRRWNELDEPCLLEIVHLSAEDRAQVKQVSHYTPDAMGLDLAADDICGFNALKINCYATVNPVSATNRPKTARRASAEHIVASFFHFADADDQQAADNIRNFVGPKCTFHVLTGTTPCHRPHVYWELEEPTRNLEAWSRTQSAISDTLKTDRVIDPPRIMRIAGTVNWPKPQKSAKGYIPELTSLRIYDPDERPPVTSERMARAFATAPKGASDSAFNIDTGPQPLDREKARIRALSGEQWNNEVFALVGSHVRRGLSDAEILTLTEDLTLSGYTVQDTRDEVQAMIDRTRRNPKFTQPEFTPNFDHAPAPTISNPAPSAPPAPTWQVQRADAFTADFVAPEYLIEGVVQRGRLYTLTAPTGSGKTAVMLYAATAIATAMDFCNLEVEHGDVLFLAGENPDDVRARVIATMDFYGIDPSKCRLHFVAGTFSIRGDIQRLKDEIAKLPNLVLVVVDTFAAYFDGEDENSNAQALDFARVIRQITAVDAKPAVIMPAHPIKNAGKHNLAPKGGSSLVNEVDGNLTLWNADGILTLHWQVKHRGPDFEAIPLELVRSECPKVRDRRGRIMPTILAKPLLETRAIQLARDTLSTEDKILLNIEAFPAMSVADRCFEVGLVNGSREPKKSSLAKMLQRLADQKLIKRFRTNWELTDGGKKAVSMIKNGDDFAEDDL